MRERERERERETKRERGRQRERERVLCERMSWFEIKVKSVVHFFKLSIFLFISDDVYLFFIIDK